MNTDPSTPATGRVRELRGLFDNPSTPGGTPPLGRAPTPISSITPDDLADSLSFMSIRTTEEIVEADNGKFFCFQGGCVHSRGFKYCRSYDAWMTHMHQKHKACKGMDYAEYYRRCKPASATTDDPSSLFGNLDVLRG